MPCNGKAKVKNNVNAYAVTRLSQYIEIFEGMGPMRLLLESFRFRRLVALEPRLDGSCPSRRLLLKSLKNGTFGTN